mmetsp:Transcript_30590/g.98272  ORF Transcript_30590/g.98272 Transcript_30590/m.98272 type:complete len:118 (+) Transcript_30590:250-603(+)
MFERRRRTQTGTLPRQCRSCGRSSRCCRRAAPLVLAQNQLWRVVGCAWRLVADGHYYGAVIYSRGWQGCCRCASFARSLLRRRGSWLLGHCCGAAAVVSIKGVVDANLALVPPIGVN